MKASTLRMLVGVTTPLILTGSVQAGFLGISTVSKPNQFGLLVVNVYAEFDRPGEDRMSAVAGTSLNPLLIEVIGGTFYNHVFGADRPPSGNLVNAFPSVAYDTFVTIGVKCVGDGPCQPNDDMIFSPGFPYGITGSSFATSVSGWGVTPFAPQGDPFNPLFAKIDGRVLIGQYSTANGTSIQGTMLLQYFSNGVVVQSVESFFVPGPGALWLLGAMGLIGSRGRRRPRLHGRAWAGVGCINDFLTLLGGWGACR